MRPEVNALASLPGNSNKHMHKWLSRITRRKVRVSYIMEGLVTTVAKIKGLEEVQQMMGECHKEQKMF